MCQVMLGQVNIICSMDFSVAIRFQAFPKHGYYQKQRCSSSFVLHLAYPSNTKILTTLYSLAICLLYSSSTSEKITFLDYDSFCSNASLSGAYNVSAGYVKFEQGGCYQNRDGGSIGNSYFKLLSCELLKIKIEFSIQTYQHSMVEQSCINMLNNSVNDNITFLNIFIVTA